MKTYLFPVLLALFLCGTVYWKYQEDISSAEIQYRVSLAGEAEQQRLVLEGKLGLLHHELHTLANMPHIRTADLSAENYGANALYVIQQVYDALAQNVGVTELYVIAKHDIWEVVPEDKPLPMLVLDPELHFEPTLSTLLHQFDIADFSSTDDLSVTQLARQRLQMIHDQLTVFEQKLGTLKDARSAGLGHPSVSVLQLIDGEGSNGWLIHAMPIYSGDGKIGGALAGVVPLAKLETLLMHDDNIVLMPSGNKVISRSNDGFWRSSFNWITARTGNPDLLFSTSLPLDVQDINGGLTLWSGRSNDEFWMREDVVSNQHFALVAGVSSLVVALGIGVILSMSRRQHQMIESRNIELEQRVSERTHELETLMEASNKYAMALSESEERHRAIFDNAADGIVIIDKKGVIEAINKAARSFFGYADNEIVNEKIDLLMPEPYRSQHYAYLERYHQSGDSKVLGLGPREAVGQKKDGTVFPIELGIAGMAVEGEKKFIGIIRDITVRKEAEESIRSRDEKLQEAEKQLMQSEKMASVGQLAAGVAHEINNPIGYINSNLGSLQSYIANLFTVLDAYEKSDKELDPSSDIYKEIASAKEDVDLQFIKEDLPELMTESLEGVLRVKQIVQDLKDFSHVDKADWQRADIHKGIESTLNIVHNEIKYKAEVVKGYGDLPEVECIPSQVNQVIMNLLVNASHAIEERGVISVATGTEDDNVWIEVKDTGKGIDQDNIHRIFDPFFTTKAVGKGTGLGLSLSYGIIQKHHGDIKVESEVGKGTTMRVILPISQGLDSKL